MIETWVISENYDLSFSHTDKLDLHVACILPVFK